MYAGVEKTFKKKKIKKKKKPIGDFTFTGISKMHRFSRVGTRHPDVT